jgi:predicted dinucleotide-binding enzyme
MFICGENPTTKKVVAQLASGTDFDVVDVEPLRAARW